VSERTEVEQLSWARLLLLHLAPGAIATALFVVLADPIQDAGYPPLAAFLVAIAVVIVPFELAVVLLAGRREPGGGPLAAVPYRRPLSLREWAVLVPLLLVVGIVGFGLLGLIDPAIRDALFGWLPDWFRELVDTDAVSDYQSSVWTLTLVAYFALNVLIGPVVEELYFRGYLLPRMSRLGIWAPIVNTALFSLYHFWTPWSFLARMAGVTPFAYAVWRTRNVYLGMVVHVLLNAIGTASLIALIASRLG
jgi:membrane protease YdiL (CAAX protease family)